MGISVKKKNLCFLGYLCALRNGTRMAYSASAFFHIIVLPALSFVAHIIKTPYLCPAKRKYPSCTKARPTTAPVRNASPMICNSRVTARFLALWQSFTTGQGCCTKITEHFIRSRGYLWWSRVFCLFQTCCNRGHRSIKDFKTYFSAIAIFGM